MAQRTITRAYDSYGAATSIVRSLEEAGIPHSDISIVGRDGAQAAPGTGTTTFEPSLRRARLTSFSRTALRSNTMGFTARPAIPPATSVTAN